MDLARVAKQLARDPVSTSQELGLQAGMTMLSVQHPKSLPLSTEQFRVPEINLQDTTLCVKKQIHTNFSSSQNVYLWTKLHC